jgi:hypothetical protein
VLVMVILMLLLVVWFWYAILNQKGIGIILKWLFILLIGSLRWNIHHRQSVKLWLNVSENICQWNQWDLHLHLQSEICNWDLPSCWKNTLITACPKLKDASHNNTQVYRPIAVTPIQARIFDKLALTNLNKVMASGDDTFQFAYKNRLLRISSFKIFMKPPERQSKDYLSTTHQPSRVLLKQTAS